MWQTMVNGLMKLGALKDGPYLSFASLVVGMCCAWLIVRGIIYD